MAEERHGDWGLGDVRGGRAAPGSSSTGSSEGLYGALQSFIRSPEFASLLERNYGLVRCAAGDIKATATDDVQAGWLLCDGATYDIQAYPRLYQAIGKVWGGDGISSFAVPDLRGRVLISRGEFTGVITLRTVGEYGGEETHVSTTAEMPTHSHVVVDPGHIHSAHLNFNAGAKASVTYAGNTFNASDFTIIDSASTGITLQNTGGNGAHNNMQPFAVVSYQIYAGSN